jgi:hypothetical protein
MSPGENTREFYRAQGVQSERERIIRLLIDKAIQWRSENLHQQADYIDFAIDLIKGEQES